jgi:hypothetical protein
MLKRLQQPCWTEIELTITHADWFNPVGVFVSCASPAAGPRSGRAGLERRVKAAHRTPYFPHWPVFQPSNMGVFAMFCLEKSPVGLYLPLDPLSIKIPCKINAVEAY